MNIFTDIALSIDRTIYTWIPYIYNLIIKLASYEVFDPGDISGLSRRIYALLGIFMLFKLTFSMISYIVNPDEFSDKSKGFSGLIKNVIISMVLIVAVPYIFAEAFYVQKMILEDGTLVKLIFSKGNDTTTDRSDIAYATRGAGEQISFVIFSQFVKPNDDIAEISENCTTIYELDESGNIIKDGDYSYKVNEECFDNTLKGLFDNDSAYTHYKDAMAYQDFNLLINDENIFSAKQKKEIIVRKSNGTIKKEYDKIRIIKYNWILSFIFGWVILSFLITLCIDVATRTIKLAFFQIIAPIPIISNCDPKAKKDGMFQKWVKACVSTYLDLFIRLVMFFLAIYIIKSFSVKFFSTNNGALTLFIVIGALVFAKQAPKIVEDLTGLKIEKFTLNPFKKVANEALLPDKVGKAIGKIGLGGLLGLGFGAGKTLASKIAGGVDAKANGLTFGQGFNSVHGKIGNALIKKAEGFAPHTMKSLKTSKEGREEVKQMNTKWTEGAKKADKLRGVAAAVGKSDVFSALDGQTTAAYNAIYKNQDYIKSRMNLDREDEKRKALTRISEATARGVSLSDAIDAESGNMYLDWPKLNAIKSSNDMNAFIKMRDDNSKAVAGMEKVHESIRKQHQADADTEDQIKFVKYNLTDPTDPSRTYNKSVGSPTGSSSTGSSSTGSSSTGSSSTGSSSTGSSSTGSSSTGSSSTGSSSTGSSSTGSSSTGSSSTGSSSTGSSSTGSSSTGSSSTGSSSTGSSSSSSGPSSSATREIELRNELLRLDNKKRSLDNEYAEIDRKIANGSISREDGNRRQNEIQNEVIDLIKKIDQIKRELGIN